MCLHCVVTVFVTESTDALEGKMVHCATVERIHVKMVFASLCDGVSLSKCSGASVCSGFNLGAVG